MPKTKIDREKVYDVAKPIATSVYSKKCCEDGCAKCPNNGDCTPIEMAYAIVDAGYELVGNNVNGKTGEAQIEDLAKVIAVSRGYGCFAKDNCSSCSCRIVQCIPMTIAEHLVNAGCTKKV